MNALKLKNWSERQQVVAVILVAGLGGGTGTGAAAVVLMSAEEAAKRGLKPLAQPRGEDLRIAEREPEVQVGQHQLIVNIQRGGPSTGLPTKTEQSDLFQAMFGRNGECPLPVLAARSPADCFELAQEAWRIAVRFMTPVVLLSDGYIANGSEPWRIIRKTLFQGLASITGR